MRWLPVQGFEGYSISDTGLVRGRRGLLLNPSIDRKGYSRIDMRVGGAGSVRKGLSVHRLVLSHFDRFPVDGEMCRHLDGDPQNNRLENLVWGSNSENQLDSVRHGTHNGFAARRFKVSEIPNIRALAGHFSYGRIARAYGVTAASIRQIHLRMSYREVA